jgi:hypothetical protein
MERNLLHHEIEHVLSNGLRYPRYQSELPGSTLIDRGTIHYADLNAGNLTFPNSGIFIPDYFKAKENTVDIIVYFHGLSIPACAGDPKTYAKLGMKSYLENNKYFESICPSIADSKKNVVFIAVTWLMKVKDGKPTYEGRSAYRNNVGAQDFNDLMQNCLAAIKSANKNGTSELVIGNIILAGHSAGGAPMQRIITGVDTKINQEYLSKIKECWGFDSQYSASTDAWVKWLKKHTERTYKHFSVGEPSRKGFNVSKFREAHPKSTVPPYMHISNLWRFLIKSKSIDSQRYYFVNGKATHCGMVDKCFKECVKTSNALTHA